MIIIDNINDESLEKQRPPSKLPAGAMASPHSSPTAPGVRKSSAQPAAVSSPLGQTQVGLGLRPP